MSHALTPIHEHLIRALRPQTGTRWLDLATGTGAVALLAARGGADVTAVDFAEPLILTARRLAGDHRLDIRFDVGDIEALPYRHERFDVISSAMGIIFAPHHRAVARELTRLCRPGGRIAFSAWREGGGWTPVTKNYVKPLPGEPEALNWSREEYVESMLGESFALRYEYGDAPVTGHSGEAIWQLLMFASGPFKARVNRLDHARRDGLHDDFVEFLDQHRRNGNVYIPAP